MFIGQGHITTQLKFILPATYELGACNFLFRGPSGYGKTELAMRVANYYAGTRYIMKLGSNLTFESDKRVHLIDEVHMCQEFEFWYPIMDSSRHILIFTTNADSTLPEAFIRRCYDFIFIDYSNSELREIVRSKSNISITNEQLDYIIASCNRSPAIILNMIQRLSMYILYNGRIDEKPLNEFTELIQQLFGIINGVDPLQQRYLNTLRRLGGTSSLANIRSALHVDTGTIKRDIEPPLLYKGKIKITSRGRSLI